MKEEKWWKKRNILYSVKELYTVTILNAVTYRKDGSTVSDYRD